MAVPDLTFRHVDRDVFTTPAHERKANPFDTGYDRTLEQLRDELHHLEATDVVCGVVLDGPAQVRQDGMLRSRANVLHPGVVLTIATPEHGTLVYTSDAFAGRYLNDPPDWQINLRAITIGLHDLRRLARYGIAKRGQQYAGWRELGSGTPVGSTAAIQTDDQVAHFLATAAGIEHLDPHDRDAVRRAYRQAAQRHHPDAGGSHAMMAYLNTARDHLLPEG
jgi:hypothetical protein